jgi:hypothetical protein
MKSLFNHWRADCWTLNSGIGLNPSSRATVSQVGKDIVTFTIKPVFASFYSFHFRVLFAMLHAQDEQIRSTSHRTGCSLLCLYSWKLEQYHIIIFMLLLLKKQPPSDLLNKWRLATRFLKVIRSIQFLLLAVHISTYSYLNVHSVHPIKLIKHDQSLSSHSASDSESFQCEGLPSSGGNT